MRLIDADALVPDICDAEIEYGTKPVHYSVNAIDLAPTIDAEVVVRCKDCKWQHTVDCPMNYEVDFFDEDDGWDRYMATNACHDDGFCWIGERKDGEG